MNELPGDNTGGATPVPIPNTEAKTVGPMVVLRGESRSSPGFFKGQCPKDTGLFLIPIDYRLLSTESRWVFCWDKFSVERGAFVSFLEAVKGKGVFAGRGEITAKEII